MDKSFIELLNEFIIEDEKAEKEKEKEKAREKKNKPKL